LQRLLLDVGLIDYGWDGFAGDCGRNAGLAVVD